MDVRLTPGIVLKGVNIRKTRGGTPDPLAALLKRGREFQLIQSGQDWIDERRQILGHLKELWSLGCKSRGYERFLSFMSLKEASGLSPFQRETLVRQRQNRMGIEDDFRPSRGSGWRGTIEKVKPEIVFEPKSPEQVMRISPAILGYLQKGDFNLAINLVSRGLGVRYVQDYYQDGWQSFDGRNDSRLLTQLPTSALWMEEVAVPPVLKGKGCTDLVTAGQFLQYLDAARLMPQRPKSVEDIETILKYERDTKILHWFADLLSGSSNADEAIRLSCFAMAQGYTEWIAAVTGKPFSLPSFRLYGKNPELLTDPYFQWIRENDFSSTTSMLTAKGSATLHITDSSAGYPAMAVNNRARYGDRFGWSYLVALERSSQREDVCQAGFRLALAA